MVKGQNLPGDVIEQLEWHCLASNGSVVSKPLYNDLQLARDDMCTERLRYLPALAIYCEAIAMVEEYHQAFSVSNLAGIRDFGVLYPQLGLRNSPQVYETLEHRMVVAKTAQRLRLPLICEDGEIHKEDIEKLSVVSRSSLDSTSTSVTINSSTSPTNYTTQSSSISGANYAFAAIDPVKPGVGGVPNRFLGIAPAYLWQTQLQRTPLSVLNGTSRILYRLEVIVQVPSLQKGKREGKKKKGRKSGGKLCFPSFGTEVKMEGKIYSGGSHGKIPFLADRAEKERGTSIGV